MVGGAQCCGADSSIDMNFNYTRCVAKETPVRHEVIAMNRIQQQSQVYIFEQNLHQMEMSDGPTSTRSRQKAAPGSEMSRTARRVPFLNWRSFISDRFGSVFLLLG